MNHFIFKNDMRLKVKGHLSLHEGLIRFQLVVQIFLLDQLQLQLLRLKHSRKYRRRSGGSSGAAAAVRLRVAPYLLDGLLVLGGPALLALQQLLQVRFHVDQLLLFTRKTNGSAFHHGRSF